MIDDVRIIDDILYDAGFFSLMFTGNLNHNVMSAILKKRNMKFQTANLPQKCNYGQVWSFRSIVDRFSSLFER